MTIAGNGWCALCCEDTLVALYTHPKHIPTEGRDWWLCADCAESDDGFAPMTATLAPYEVRARVLAFIFKVNANSLNYEAAKRILRDRWSRCARAIPDDATNDHPLIQSCSLFCAALGGAPRPRLADRKEARA